MWVQRASLRPRLSTTTTSTKSFALNEAQRKRYGMAKVKTEVANAVCYAPIATVYTTINKSNLSCRGRRVITGWRIVSLLVPAAALYQQRGPMKKPTMDTTQAAWTHHPPHRADRIVADGAVSGDGDGLKNRPNAVRNMLDLLKKEEGPRRRDYVVQPSHQLDQQISHRRCATGGRR